MAEFQRRGVMLVLASPSGAGKSSITRALFAQDPGIFLSVSVTTRARRTDEIEGTHYYFRDVKTFERMRDNDELLEWARVHDNYYGTPRAQVEEQLSRGNDILFDIDYQGTLQLYEKCRDDMVTVFILPPSITELKSRLERRAQDFSRHHREAAEERPHRDGALRRVRLRPRQRRPRSLHPTRPLHPRRRAFETRTPERVGWLRQRPAVPDRRALGQGYAVSQPVQPT